MLPHQGTPKLERQPVQGWMAAWLRYLGSLRSAPRSILSLNTQLSVRSTAILEPCGKILSTLIRNFTLFSCKCSLPSTRATTCIPVRRDCSGWWGVLRWVTLHGPPRPDCRTLCCWQSGVNIFWRTFREPSFSLFILFMIYAHVFIQLLQEKCCFMFWLSFEIHLIIFLDWKDKWV